MITNFVSATESPPSIDQLTQNVEEPEKNADSATENAVRDFDKVYKPRRPYLTSMVLMNSTKWRNTNVLLSEPFRKLTAPFVNFVQRIYVLLALIQLLYMVLFAAFCSPTACSLSQRFDVSLPSCNYSSGDRLEGTLAVNEPARCWWLVWPCVMFLSSSGYLIWACARALVDKCCSVRPKVVACSVASCETSGTATTLSSSDNQSNESETKNSSSCHSPSTSLGSEGADEIDGNFVSQRPNSVMCVANNVSLTYTATNESLSGASAVKPSTRTAPPKPRSRPVNDCQDISFVTINLFPLIAFCVAVFLWYTESLFSVTMSTYVQSTSMVFLFGWTTSFVFFSAVKREFYLFSLVLREFIAKDVCYKFIPLFFFTVVAFSFSISSLQLQSKSVGEVGYELILIATAVADPFEQKTPTEKRADRPLLLQIVLTVYVYWTAVILLNVLIAMMNHRYDSAKVRAERDWRFRSVEIALAIQNCPLYRRIMRQLARHTALCRFLRCDELYHEDSQQFLVAIVESNRPPVGSDAQLA